MTNDDGDNNTEEGLAPSSFVCRRLGDNEEGSPPLLVPLVSTMRRVPPSPYVLFDSATTRGAQPSSSVSFYSATTRRGHPSSSVSFFSTTPLPATTPPPSLEMRVEGVSCHLCLQPPPSARVSSVRGVFLAIHNPSITRNASRGVFLATHCLPLPPPSLETRAEGCFLPCTTPLPAPPLCRSRR